jgi:hypoxanthine phosphoribosyltransferase
MSVFTRDMVKKGLTAWGPHSTQPATELDKYVIKSRKGMVLIQNTILKEDYWFKSTSNVKGLKGASNFRKLGGFPVYGVAQPTLQGVKNVLETLASETPNVLWINLREEPFVYINGIPYVLRDMTFTLRNLKSFKGVTPGSLEIIESKLKSDVCRELELYDGKILLHSETENGSILPIWEHSTAETVLSLQEAMSLVKDEMSIYSPNTSAQDLLDTTNKISLMYYRVPQTAESAPEAEDMDKMIHILRSINLECTSVVINCQIGIGRSTVGMVVATLILRWLGMENIPLISKKSFDSPVTKNYNYQVIHSLLRVIRNGIECKRVVDQIIDAAATLVNIRDTIEESRHYSETEPDPLQKDHYRKKGIVALDRYFTLILFQSYLDQNPPGLESELISFKSWISQHPEFDTIREEMLGEEMDPLVPVDEMEPGDGIALSNEVVDVVNRRRGAVLSQGTIVKFDLFPGAQKMSLKDRIDGAHNFRSIPICEILNFPAMEANSGIGLTHVAGVGMPTKEGIQAVLNYMDAGPLGKKAVYWTSLREEPVIYIKGKPYVLRLFIEPIKVTCI